MPLNFIESKTRASDRLAALLLGMGSAWDFVVGAWPSVYCAHQFKYCTTLPFDGVIQTDYTCSYRAGGRLVDFFGSRGRTDSWIIHDDQSFRWGTEKQGERFEFWTANEAVRRYQRVLAELVSSFWKKIIKKNVIRLCNSFSILLYDVIGRPTCRVPTKYFRTVSLFTRCFPK